MSVSHLFHGVLKPRRRFRHERAGYDWLLRFDPEIQRSYDKTFGAVRLSDLTRSILVGLVLYNSFFFTSALLMPDIAHLNLILRFVIVTPPSLGIILILRYVSPRAREWWILAGMFNAHIAMVMTVWMSDSPLTGYAVSELSLILVFGAFTLGMRLPQAILFLTTGTVVTLLLIGQIGAFSDTLRTALWLQTVTAYVFCLYGNILIERRRCQGYMEAYRASERANFAEEESHEMQKLSRTDPLTGLANRRALQLQVQLWTHDAAPVTIVMIDIDHFKLYNDTLGHPEGDTCLRTVSDTLRASLADLETCLLARIGGEEFAIALKGASAQNAGAVAERARIAVQSLALPHPGRMDGPDIVTISLGLARPSPGSQTDLSDLLKRADLSLYEAKRRGRNEVFTEDADTAAA